MHFSCFVITRNGDLPDIEALMEPYSEHREVEPYDRPCGCRGMAARMGALEQPGPEMKDIALARTETSERLREINEEILELSEGDQKRADELAEEEEVLQERQPRIEREYAAVFQAALVAHPLFDKPDHDCSECEGSGTETVSWNPEGRWDYYTIGGRWSGTFEGRDWLTTETAVELLDEGKISAPYAIVTDQGWTALETLSYPGGPPTMSPREVKEKTREALADHPGMTVTVIDYHS